MEPSLGSTLLGEHIRLAPAGSGYWGSGADAALAVAVAALTELREAGVETVVDATTIEAGRDLPLAARAAQAAGIVVVCSTGLAAGADVSPAFRSLPATRLADVFVQELTSGVCGAIALAFADAHIFDDTALLAVAFAHAETGAPVLLEAPAEQLDTRVADLMARGVDGERIVARGVDTARFADLDAVAGHGARLGFSRVGGDDSLAVASLVAYAVRRYGSDRVTLGTGAPAVDVRVPGAPAPEAEQPRPAARLARFAADLATFGVDVDDVLGDGADVLFTPPPELVDA